MEPDPAAVIRNLVKRDDRVLRLVGKDVLPGAAFSLEPQAEQLGEEGERLTMTRLEPLANLAGISGRIRNLYLLELDLQGRLGEFLSSTEAEEAA